MKFLNDILFSEHEYSALLNGVNKNRLPIAATGLSAVHKAAVISALHAHTGKKIAVITPDEATANCLGDDLKALGVQTVDFPYRDYLLADIAGYSKEYEHKRTDTLSKLLDGDFGVVTMSLDAALQYTTPPEILQKANFCLEAGQTISIA